MKANLQPDRIQLSDFKLLLAKYNDVIPKQLADLEQLRLDTIPEAIADRATATGEGSYLEKDELRSLVEWKLYVILTYIYIGLHGYLLIFLTDLKYNHLP